MILPVRQFIGLVTVFLLVCQTALAQQLTITSVTPNPVCAGSSITAAYSYTAADQGVVYLYLNGPNTSDLIIGAVATNGGNGSITATIPANRIAGTYTVRIIRVSNATGNTQSPNSAGFLVNATPAPGVANVAYCQNAPAVALTASGQSLKWYTVETGGTGVTTVVPSTTAVGGTTYYVSQTLNNCEGPRAAQQVTINALPPRPTVVSSVSYCQNATPRPLPEAVTSGSSLKWYTSPLGGMGNVEAPKFSTGTVGATTYYVSQTDGNTCESDRAAITVIIKANPNPPSVSSSPVVYCQNTSASSLSATASAGGILNWYNPANNFLGNTAPTPPTSAPGTTVYTVSQTISGCESTRASITITINPKPAPPTTTPLGACLNGPVPSILTVISGTGSNPLKWYANITGGAGTSATPALSTSSAGQTVYYVTQTNANGCESDRSAITYTVNPLPGLPAVSSPITYCYGATANPLSATGIAGSTLNWYTTSSGGPRFSSLTPSTTASNIYYVSQTVNGCESSRASITVIINALPAKPTVGLPPTYCQLAPASPLSATANTNNTLFWYDPSNNPLGSVAPTPPTINAGVFSYYVSQKDPIGCESERAVITVTVNPKPTPPTTTTLSACLNGPIPSILTAVSGIGSNNTLKWYTVSTGGVALAATPVLSTSAVGAVTYYVSQTNATNCESDRSAVTFTVNPLPPAPTVASKTLFYCQGTTPPSLTATGTGPLKWYTTPTGGTPLTNLVPPTLVAGRTIYYVRQTDGNSCESLPESVTVIVGSKPAPPTPGVANVAYCQGGTASPLLATALSGNTLRWYGTEATGGTASLTATIPSTSTAGTARYYVSQIDGNGCESDRAFITVAVNIRPAAPATTPISLCQNAAPVSITSYVTPTLNTSLKWYTTQSGGTALPAPPQIVTSTPGFTAYYVSQTDGNSCESDRSPIQVTIKPLPSAPLVAPGSVILCQGSVAAPLSATGTGTLKWYDPANNTFTSITPSTDVVAPTVYRVSQIVDGCEGQPASLTVIVIRKPEKPTVVVPAPYCQIASTVALSATGLNLKWFTVPTGGTSTTVAPIPSSANAGTTTYYVSQTDANGCESDRASIAVVVKPKPAPPVTAPISFCANQVTSLTATFDNGSTQNWYGTTSTGGTPTTTAPIPTTTVIGAPVLYYVSQTVNGCESDRTSIAVTIKALPNAPAVSAAPVLYCQGVTAAALSATAVTGGNLNWYTTATGGPASSTAPIPPTANSTPPTTYYYVSQTVDGCEGPRATIAVTVNPKPAKPTAVASLTYCQNAVAPVLSASAAGTLKWYEDATNGPAIPAPTPSTTTPGVKTYYVSQTDANGCESDRASIAVNITPLPTAPAVSPNALTLCQNSTALPLSATATPGGSLRWYNSQGTLLPSAPTPSVNITGTTSYSVSQLVNNCEGPRASITVIVNPLPSAPSVATNSISFCQGSTASPLSATATPGGILTWYTTETGGTPSFTAPIPPTSAAGTTIYYVSQSVMGCEGPRASITVTVNPLPPTPSVSTNSINYCQNVQATALTAIASPGGTLNWYTTPTEGVPSPIAPIPQTSAAGVTVYYVSQTVNSCEGSRTGITVTVTALPPAPGVSASTITLCQNSPASPLTATTSPGGILNWYTSATGGLPSPVAPSPPTSVATTTIYYVSQSVNGCEGPRTSITVTVNPLPTAPGVSASTISLCQNSPSTALTAIGAPDGILNWYTTPVGGVPTTVAPVPPTSVAGTTIYYVSQSVNGCEGARTSITVIVKPLPTAPVVSPTPLTYCQGITAVALTATAANGGSLNWYGTTPTGLPSPTPTIPATTTPGLFTYYVSTTLNGCEGPQASIVTIVQATPAAPTIGNAPVYCQGGTATALSAVADPGGILNWYASQTGGTPSLTPPIPPVGTSGTVTYYVSQSISGCEGPRVSLTATIRPTPAPPIVTPSLAYCQGTTAPALVATPTVGSLNWYTAPTGGSSSTVAPIPATNTAGNTIYYVSQTDAIGCESSREPITVKVNALPVAPTTTPISVCQNLAPSSLALAVNASGPVNWYTTQTGGTPSPVAPVPTTTSPGVITYYVSQTDANSCESNRSLLLVTVTAIPAAPAVPAIPPICQNSTPVVLSAAGQDLKWYSDAASTTSLGSSVIQPTSQAGTFTYYVSQTLNGCEGPRTQVQVVVNAVPAAPTVANQNVCQDTPAQPITAVGINLQWYDGIDNQIAPPTPTTQLEATQTFTYKVTQTVNGCTSPKATLSYTVNVTPPPTVVPSVGYCQNAKAAPLQASGTGLKWIDPTGAVTSSAPIPQTAIFTPGLSYFVTQTSSLGCESRRAEIKVIVNALPTAKLEGTTTTSLGSPALLTLTLTGTGPYSYTLSDGTSGIVENAGNSDITVKQIAITPKATATYTIAAISNACGIGTATGTATVTVNIPTIATSTVSASTICTNTALTVPFTTTGEFTPGNAFIVEIASATGDTTKYIPISNATIVGPGSSTSITTTIPNTVAGGQYYVRVVALNSSYPISGKRSPTLLTVRAAPSVAFSASKTTIYAGEKVQLNFTFAGEAPWNVKYLAGSVEIPLASTTNLYSLTVAPTTTTTYKLTYVSNGCGEGRIEGTGQITIEVSVLTAETDPFGSTVKVYPVPTDGDVTVDIDIPLQKEPAQLQLTDLKGNVTDQLTTRQRQTTLHLDKQAGGIYLLHIKIGDRSTVRRIIKQ